MRRSTMPLRTRHLTAAEVLAFRDDAFQQYYRAPRYLESVERKFGAATRRDIEAMTSHRLQRAILGSRMEPLSV